MSIIKISNRLRLKEDVKLNIIKIFNLEKFRIISESRFDTSVIKVNSKIDSKLVILSGLGESRNAWLSQPMLNIMNYLNYNKDDIYFYNRSELVKPTLRNIFDIKCLKTFGIKFIGIDKIGDIKISNIEGFQTKEELLDYYYKLVEKSKLKKNDITEITALSDYIEIINGKTDGANKGSLFMPIIGLIQLSKVIVYTRENHDFGKPFLRFMKSIGVDFKISEDEFTKIINYDQMTKSVNDLRNQDQCTRNVKKRVGHENCEITNDSNYVITSHIIPVNYCNILLESNKISKVMALDLCNSGNNALRLTSSLDKLFDGGLIGFDDYGNIIISKNSNLSEYNKSIIEKYTTSLELNDKLKTSLYLHRKYIFTENKKDIRDISDDDIQKIKSIIE
jgi:hypothetical protein